MADARQAGFTLVEVLVSLALGALIAVLLVDTMRVAGTAASAARLAESAEQVQSVRDHLRRTLGSLAGRHRDDAPPVLVGGPDALSAAIAADRSLERAADLVVVLSGVPRPDGAYDLVESRAPREPEAGRPPGGPAEILLERVPGLAIRYFGAPADGAEPAWQTAWNRRDRPPRLVEIRIPFAPTDRRRWLPLLIATGGQP